MSDPKVIGPFLFKVAESIGALQQEPRQESMPNTRRFASTFKKIGSLEILINVAISSFREGQATLKFDRSCKRESGL